MGYWVKPGYLPEAIDISEIDTPESEISSELTRIARTAIVHRSILNQPGRPSVEIPDRTFADEDSIVAGFGERPFSERPTEIEAPPAEDTQERTRVDPGLAAAIRKAARRRRTSDLRAPTPLPTSFAPAPRGVRPAHADPPAPTVLPAENLVAPEVRWEPTASLDRSMVTADLELDFEPSDASAERWPGPWPEAAPVPPINHSRPAPLELPPVRPGAPGAAASLTWLVWLGVLFAAGLGLLLGAVASLLFLL